MNASDATLDNPDAYAGSHELCSWVSQPKRCSLWGDARFRGNCDGTLFKDLVHWYRPTSIADPMVGSGTTADVIDGLRQRGLYGGEYWCNDLSRGFNILTDPMGGTFDFIWIHPPYWNIIRYSEDAADLSTIDEYDDFRRALALALVRCSEHLRTNGRLAVLIGDVRRRGQYYPLGREVMRLDGRIGTLRSVIIKAQHNCSSDSKRYGRFEDVPIKHEYCLVFRRG